MDHLTNTLNNAPPNCINNVYQPPPLLGEIRELCGCDLLTISPKLLGELQDSQEDTPIKLSQEAGE